MGFLFLIGVTHKILDKENTVTLNNRKISLIYKIKMYKKSKIRIKPTFILLINLHLSYLLTYIYLTY
jgi:hypothetical protein